MTYDKQDQVYPRHFMMDVELMLRLKGILLRRGSQIAELLSDAEKATLYDVHNAINAKQKAVYDKLTYGNADRLPWDKNS